MLMLRKEWHVLGTEVKKLFVREWLPEGAAAKACVLIIHGHGEHGERYNHVAEKMTDAGFAVVVYDLLGHGRSEGKRGHMSAMSAAIDDALRVMDDIQENHGDLPIIVYGHSMGGNIALNCALRRKPDIAGLILSSPWLRLAFKPPAVKEWIGKAVARILPTLSMSTGLKERDLFRPSDLNIPSMTEDSLSHTTITPRAYLEVQQAGEWALKHAEELQAPLLLLHGSGDNITSFDASAGLARKLVDRCEWIPCEDGRHELHNDVGSGEVIDRMIVWINNRLS